MINLPRIQVGSSVPGLQDLGPVDTSLFIPTFTIPGPQGTTATRSLTVSYPRSDVFSIARMQYVGATNLGAYWVPIIGSTSLFDSAPGATTTTNYRIDTTVTSSPSGRLVTIVFVNNINNATVTIPNITVNFHAHLYAYPWKA